MKHLIKTVSFLAVMSVIPGAFAATSRVSVMGKTTSRLPSIAGYVNPVAIVTGTAGTVIGSSTASSLLTNADCIDAYKSCINGADACGADFEECTTNVLFHAQMPKCLSVLSQCSASGINDLFGTSSVAALSTVAEQNTYGEVTRYTYPTDGSVLGQMILGAAIANKYDTQTCVKRYTSCLKKDNVCGNDFELCTTGNEFKKQAVLCASTLARCQSEGIIELYGQTNTSVPPKSDSRLGMMITDGAELAAANAVSTCYKVADQCILNACGANPAQCTEESAVVQVNMIDAINGGNVVAPDKLSEWSGKITKSDVNKYLRNMCQETIGGNKYCYMTSELGGGKTPKATDLTDDENRELVFSDIYASRMNSAMKQRLQTLLEKFDEKTKDKCVNTIKSCAMRACGGGVGSVCYKLVFKNGKGSINGVNTYDEIRTACEAITNTDPNCQYALASADSSAYLYTYTDNNTFTTLFPAEEAGTDPIGVVGLLNASLATSYNDAAIANMKKQCANTAVSCVKSMCGKDYANCYRNRTDVYTNMYDTGSTAFDKSMNKMGGVLDYTIVTGLCVQTVKNSKVCEEHLKIESVTMNKNKFNILGQNRRLFGLSTQQSSWGSDSVRNDWLGAADSISVTAMQHGEDDIVMGCRTASENCKNNNNIEECGYVDEDGCLYDQEVTQTWDDYVVDQSATTLFQQVLMDIEKEAQAKYKAKLNKEQNICLGQNHGGIQGVADNGSTFKWVKLKSNKIPKNYGMKGLNTNQFVNSNDLYGSFCLSKITVQSDDKKIQDLLTDGSTAYFAVGDAFTCGSWIDQKQLDKITDAVRKEAGKNEGVSSWKGKVTMLWTALGGAALGGAAGGLIADSLQGGGKLGGLIKNDDAKVAYSDKTNAGSCVNNLNKCLSNRSNSSACRSGYNDAIAAGVEVGGFYIADNGASTSKCTESSPSFCSSNVCKDSAKATRNCCNATTDEDSKLKWTAIADRANRCYFGGRTYDINQVIVGAITSANINEVVVQQVLADCKKKAQETYDKNRGLNVGLGATLGALTVGGLGAGIAATALEAKKRKVMDKAEKEWLEQVGEHIQCYLGADNIGSYGYIVSFNFDE
ncbi:MAG: hypothetical protein IJL05_02935 [Alphaproteobacteria bacterium]|nr:hypothetical protein [Alphaproteobacteria bacterium]